MTKQFLGFDVGTQGTKGVVIDSGSGSVVARASRSYGTITGLPPGASEQDPQMWLDAVSAVSQELLSDPAVRTDSVAGVGVSGQQHGLVVLDEEDEVIRAAKLWNDTSCARECDSISAFQGWQMPISYTATKVLWLKEHEPEHWERTRAILLPHDYVNFALTGRMSMEPGDASGTGFFDPVRRAFTDSLIEFIDPGIREMLPPLTPPGEPAGVLDERGAALLGLRPGVLVSAGAGDNMASAIGSGATEPGPVIVSLGTSGTCFEFSDQPVFDPKGWVAAFCDSTGGWLPLVTVMSMTGVTEQMRGLWPDESHESLTAKAAAVPPGADGLMLVPYLGGERTPPLPEATGTLRGLTYQNLAPGHLFRAAIEGVTLNLAWGIARMADLGLPMSALRVVGGGARNPLWRQILANVTELPVQRLLEPESAALGAAIQAQWTQRGGGDSVTAIARPYVRLAGGVESPQPAASRMYAQLREEFVDSVLRSHPGGFSESTA